jgi:hypothetical protein
VDREQQGGRGEAARQQQQQQQQQQPVQATNWQNSSRQLLQIPGHLLRLSLLKRQCLHEGASSSPPPPARLVRSGSVASSGLVQVSQVMTGPTMMARTAVQEAFRTSDAILLLLQAAGSCRPHVLLNVWINIAPAAVIDPQCCWSCRCPVPSVPSAGVPQPHPARRSPSPLTCR